MFNVTVCLFFFPVYTVLYFKVFRCCLKSFIVHLDSEEQSLHFLTSLLSLSSVFNYLFPKWVMVTTAHFHLCSSACVTKALLLSETCVEKVAIASLLLSMFIELLCKITISLSTTFAQKNSINPNFTDLKIPIVLIL